MRFGGRLRGGASEGVRRGRGDPLRHALHDTSPGGPGEAKEDGVVW